MSKLKKVLLMCTAYVLVAALAIGGTIAYLQDSDSDVNVMTLGNVSIRQNEEQRVDPSKNGTLTDADIEDFEQAKPIYPYVDVNINGAMRDDYEEITFPNGKTHKLFIGDNAIDKLVSVTNTGKTDAYVRTIVALEAPTDKIDLSFNSADWTMDKTASSHSIEVDGVKYDLFVCVYKNALKPGETTPYSLLQIILDGTATNEDAAAYGNTYDVLVLSQAVQVAGFANATTALDTAFGVVDSVSAAEWFKGIAIPEVVQGDIVSSSTGYGYSVANGESVVFDDVDLTTSGGGINIQGAAVFNSGSVVNDSTSTNPRHMFYVAARENVANGHLTINDGEFTFSPSNLTRKGYYICADGEGAVVIINGGTFGKPSTRDNYKAGIGELNGGEVIIKGGTFGFDPTNWVADGYEAVQNGNTWTVVAK